MKVMSLPLSFQSPSQYFEECLKVFGKYQHLYNFANTDLLSVNTLSEISIDNLENINVFDPKFDLGAVDNFYLKEFFTIYDKLLPKYEEFEDEAIEMVVDVPLSLKKKHEILYLAKEIINVCKEFECNTIVDFGSGLGYLDQQLCELTNCNVLGLECNEQHYIGAKKRQRRYHIDSTDRVKYVKHTIAKNSTMKIKQFVDDKFPNSRGVCIVGLHACADLTVDAMDIFLKMDVARSIVIMPCCYHRIQTKSNNSFCNFPLSKALKNIYENKGFEQLLTIPFLRLATQGHMECDANLKDLVFNLLARAVLQLYGRNHKYKLKRKKRKAVRMNKMHNDFEKYARDAAKGFLLVYDSSNENEESSQIHDDNCDLQFDLEELISIWRQIDDVTFKKCGIFILLQNYLQPVLENFVLYDRLVYLQENNVHYCKFKKILNSNVSPRCLALIAHK